MENLCFRTIAHRLSGMRDARQLIAGTLLVCIVVGCNRAPKTAESPAGDEQRMTLFRLEYTEPDETVAQEIEGYLAHGRQLVETFFEMPFVESVNVRVCPSREAFTASFPPEWGMTETQRWMVAAGVADKLIILSPRVWGEEADEHDPLDTEHVQDIVVHELVHVFHGQHNPTRDFTGAEQLGWFIEGLAVHVSGQLAHGHLAEPSEAIERDAVPTRLADAWSGKYRYGVCGSLVAYLDATCGRDTLRDMLAVTNQADLLALAGATESQLFDQWQRWVVAE